MENVELYKPWKSVDINSVRINSTLDLVVVEQSELFILSASSVHFQRSVIFQTRCVLIYRLHDQLRNSCEWRNSFYWVYFHSLGVNGPVRWIQVKATNFMAFTFLNPNETWRKMFEEQGGSYWKMSFSIYTNRFTKSGEWSWFFLFYFFKYRTFNFIYIFFIWPIGLPLIDLNYVWCPIQRYCNSVLLITCFWAQWISKHIYVWAIPLLPHLPDSHSIH